jgi:hypothetical protein
VESLDEVIDAMIADRVIHRHRRKWLIVIALVVVLAVVVFFTGGWKEKKGRTVPTLSNVGKVDSSTTVTAGKWEYSFSKAQIVRTPKDKYSEAKAELRVFFDLKNVDSEEHTSDSLSGKLLVLVPGGGKDTVESNGADCRGELNWVVVYGLPPESCFTKFDVDPDFNADIVEIGVLGEQYISDNGLLGASEDPYWHDEVPVAVVQLKPTVVVDHGEN